MTSRWLPLTAAVLLGLGVAVEGQAPAKPRTPPKTPPRPSAAAAKAEAELRPLVERYFLAWSTRNPDRPASLYASDPDLVFYDLTGAPHVGWEAYRKARTEFFAEFSSVQLVPQPGFQVRSAGTLGWTAANFTGTAVTTGRESLQLAGRHTAVWERQGSDWRIVHEHLSIPFESVAALEAHFRPPVSEAVKRAAVTTIFDQYEQAWNRGDATALAALWHENGDIVTLAAGSATRGRTAVAAMWSDVVSRRQPNFSTVIDVQAGDIRVIGEDAVLVDGTFDYWRAGADRAGGKPAAQERFSSVLTGDEGQWGIVSLRVAEVPQRPPAPPTKPRR